MEDDPKQRKHPLSQQINCDIYSDDYECDEFESKMIKSDDVVERILLDSMEWLLKSVNNIGIAMKMSFMSPRFHEYIESDHMGVEYWLPACQAVQLAVQPPRRHNIVGVKQVSIKSMVDMAITQRVFAPTSKLSDNSRRLLNLVDDKYK